VTPDVPPMFRAADEVVVGRSPRCSSIAISLASLPTMGERSHILAISGDRRFIASAGVSAAVRVWDTSADPGEQERERVWISPLLAPGGRAVALNSGDHLEIWDVAAERRLPVERPSGSRSADAFDGASLAFSRGAVVDGGEATLRGLAEL
jgi:hypothetical protein